MSHLIFQEKKNNNKNNTLKCMIMMLMLIVTVWHFITRNKLYKVKVCMKKVSSASDCRSRVDELDPSSATAFMEIELEIISTAILPFC